jgi:hypothetical protein
LPIRSRCWPTRATICRTCSGCCSPGARPGWRKRPPSRRFSYGLRGATILAALGNAIILLIAVGFIVYNAVMRLIIPDLVQGETVMIVAGIGIVINGVTAWMFARGRKGDINIPRRLPAHGRPTRLCPQAWWWLAC